MIADRWENFITSTEILRRDPTSRNIFDALNIDYCHPIENSAQNVFECAYRFEIIDKKFHE